jgi:hypothetical protein
MVWVMERRRAFSWLLPIVGLSITLPEILRLLEARRVAEACLAQAQDQASCAAAPDVLFLVVAVVFGLVFAGRLVQLAIEYRRSGR